MSEVVRTRFAPSPTGFMHVGGVRTALFAWLLARQAGGQFILRLEDTDKVREVEGSGDHIMKSLRWLGLEWDEGPDKGGPFAPYLQSDRLGTYQEWAKKLVAMGRAYADPYTQAEVEEFRNLAKAEKRPFLYRHHRPENPPIWDGTLPLRFKSNPKPYTWTDAVMGEISMDEGAIDDFILIKSDGYPTYNLAHIIDDLLMECTHVIRSQEFVSSVPKFLNLYDALEIEWPILATLPYVMGPDGKKKLGKRDGAKDILDYAKDGYLPETMLNFLATLGWNDGTEQEIFSVDELIARFSLDRVQKSGAAFDEKRLLWMNGSHIRALDIDSLYERIEERRGERGEGEDKNDATSDSQLPTPNSEAPSASSFWPASAANYDEAYRKRVLGLVQERLKYFAELPELTDFFFEDLPVNPELISGNKHLGKLSPEEIKNLLTQARETIEQSDFTVQDLTDRLNALLEKTGQKPGILFSLIRIATTQAPASPPLAETLSVLGKEITLRRLDQ